VRALLRGEKSRYERTRPCPSQRCATSDRAFRFRPPGRLRQLTIGAESAGPSRRRVVRLAISNYVMARVVQAMRTRKEPVMTHTNMESVLNADPIAPHSAARDLDELLTVDEVASILKVSRSWVYEHTRARGVPRSERLPHIKVGKYVRFNARSVREFLQRRAHDGVGVFGERR
jgi:excisionase family DNA binding protein